MKSNNKGQHDSNNGKPLDGAEQKDSGAEFDFEDLFGNEWDRLAPENAKPLTRIKEQFNFKGTDEWTKSADVFLLPFHSFAEGSELNIEFQRKLPDADLNIDWTVLYLHQQSGTAALYEADLLVLKRRIYEQGNELKDILEIDLETDLTPLIEKYKNTDEFQRLFHFNATISAELRITRNQKQAGESKAGPRNLINAFSRFNDASISSDSSDENNPETFLRVGLDEYWLDWVEAARRAEFDFDHISSLQPIEMRFYELTQLLRFRNAQKPTDELKKASLEINYNEFTKLMPIPRLNTFEQVENQMNELCQNHLKRGYLENITIKPIERKGIFADADLQINFQK